MKTSHLWGMVAATKSVVLELLYGSRFRALKEGQLIVELGETNELLKT